jgi:hypothetical protein
VTLSRQTTPRQSGSIDGAFDFVNHETRDLDTGDSGGRESGTPRSANKQTYAELALQIADLSRERRLGDAKMLRCGAERGFVGNADDVPELSKVHDDVPATGAEAANVCRVCAAR